MMKQTNSKGEPLTCKFCHAQVWFDDIDRRYYNIGGTELHVESCERRKQFYKSQAAESAESRRQKLN
jgi:hypothetical protein